MEPVQDWKGRATLVDLLDRVLDKGVIIHLDLIVSVAGIPLIGVNLRAALAGMETMLQYGMMRDMDAESRLWEAQHRKNKKVPLLKGEEVVLDMFGSYHYMRGIYKAWRSGRVYLTQGRLFLYQQDLGEVVFETELQEIRAIAVRKERSFTGKDKDIICLCLKGGNPAFLNVLDTERFRRNLERLAAKTGAVLDNAPPIEAFDERASRFLMEGEKVSCKGKMWCWMPESGAMGETWKPGHLYLTDKRLCWWRDFEEKVIFQIPIEGISAAAKERRDLSPVLKGKEVLDVIYSDNGSKKVVSFSGKEADEWEKALNGVLAHDSKAREVGEKETCPQCGERCLEETLLKRGCPDCGWRSPRLKKAVAEILKA